MVRGYVDVYTNVLFTQVKKSFVIVINSSSPKNNLPFIIFQNSINDDLWWLFEACLTTTWSVHTEGNF